MADTTATAAAVVAANWESIGHAVVNLQKALAEPSFWIGLALVLLFANNRFAATRLNVDRFDPPVTARSFTTRFRYLVAAASYVGVFAFIYFILVSIGSFQTFQTILQKAMGALSIDGEAATNGNAIGTPMWAALATTALLPSLPGFPAVDEKVRDLLHEFASVPFTARRLAEAFLAAVRHQVAPDMDDDPDAPFSVSAVARDARAARFIRKGVRNLCNIHDVRAAKDYDLFFGRYQSYWQGLLHDLEKLEKAAAEKVDGGEPVAGEELEALQRIGGELDVLLRRSVRFLSCALLHVEGYENLARRRVSGDFRVHRLEEEGWQFGLMQIFLAMFCVIAGTFLGGIVAVYLAAFWSTGGFDLLAVRDDAARLLGLTVLTVPMFTLPLVFAAGVRMYLSDRAAFNGRSMPWEETLLAYFVTFVGAYGLSCLPQLLAAAALASPEAGVDLTRVLPEGLAPAVFALIFMFMSSTQPVPAEGHSRRVRRVTNAAIDIVVHGVPVALLTLVMNLFLAAEGDRLPPLTATEVVVPTVMALFIAGVLAPIECSISRRHVHAGGRRAAAAGGASEDGARPAGRTAPAGWPMSVDAGVAADADFAAEPDAGPVYDPSPAPRAA